VVRPVEGAGFYLYRVTANQRPCRVRREVKKGTRSLVPFCYSHLPSLSLSLSLFLLSFSLHFPFCCSFSPFLSLSPPLLLLSRGAFLRRDYLRKLVNEPLVFIERSRRLEPSSCTRFNTRPSFWADMYYGRYTVQSISPLRRYPRDPLGPFFCVPLFFARPLPGAFS